jgi:hypothetical protein
MEIVTVRPPKGVVPRPRPPADFDPIYTSPPSPPPFSPRPSPPPLSPTSPPSSPPLSSSSPSPAAPSFPVPFSPGDLPNEDLDLSPLRIPEGDDPLYRAVGNLLSSRPAPAQATPVVVQGRPTNPWPIALVGLAAVGAVAYVMARRGK